MKNYLYTFLILTTGCNIPQHDKEFDRDKSNIEQAIRERDSLINSGEFNKFNIAIGENFMLNDTTQSYCFIATDNADKNDIYPPCDYCWKIDTSSSFFKTHKGQLLLQMLDLSKKYTKSEKRYIIKKVRESWALDTCTYTIGNVTVIQHSFIGERESKHTIKPEPAIGVSEIKINH